MSRLLASLALLAFSLGCGQANAVANAKAAQARAIAAQKAAAAARAAAQQNDDRADSASPTSTGATAKDADEAAAIWDIFYLKGTKIGYGQTTTRDSERDGRATVEITSLNHLDVERFGQRSVQDLKLTTIETPEGEVLQFKTEVAFGPAPMVVVGQVEGPQMVISTSTQGVTRTTQIAWSKDIGGFRAMEQSLERKPLVPGEKRALKMLMPLVNQVAGVELTAGDFEQTSVLGVETRLLRIEWVARLPDGNAIRSIVWTDAQGQAIKTRLEGLDQESFRTTKELALAPPSSANKTDLGLDLLVKLPQPLVGAHQARELRYRVELTDADPAKVFASGPTQTVHPLDARAAELRVRSIRPGDPAPEASQDGAPVEKIVVDAKVGPEYTAANNVLQVDDAKIQQMAREARASETNPSETALALERYVHRIMTKKNFSQAFATAAEVAESREGDCTEHAVLLAALARACQIPSRVAIGLVYVEHEAGFGYHMWTEVFLEGRWIPLDATLAQGGIGAGHIKLTDSSLDGASAYSSFLPVAQVAGQLKIRVLNDKN